MVRSEDLADLDELATDRDGLRVAIRAAVESDLEPLHELTRLLQRFAEQARTTGHALRARTAMKDAAKAVDPPPLLLGVAV